MPDAGDAISADCRLIDAHDLLVEMAALTGAVVRWSAGIWHVTGATHLLPEAGALSQVADLAAGWFGRHFARTDAIAPAA